MKKISLNRLATEGSRATSPQTDILSIGSNEAKSSVVKNYFNFRRLVVVYTYIGSLNVISHR